jgi:putative salt-induced outer membrane protein
VARSRHALCGATRLVAIAAITAGGAHAQAASPKPVWDLKLGVSYVATSGNSTTSSAGASLDYDHRFALWSLTTSASGLRSSENGVASAERYSAGARGTTPLAPQLGLTGGAKWERDHFAGIDARLIADAGLEWKVIDVEPYHVSATGGLSWIGQRPVVGPVDQAWGGVAGLKAAITLSPHSKASASATYYPNFQHGDDWRFESALAIEADLTRLLSLKAAWELHYANVPVTAFKKTDTATTVSLVLSAASAAMR